MITHFVVVFCVFFLKLVSPILENQLCNDNIGSQLFCKRFCLVHLTEGRLLSFLVCCDIRLVNAFFSDHESETLCFHQGSHGASVRVALKALLNYVALIFFQPTLSFLKIRYSGFPLNDNEDCAAYHSQLQ